MKLEVTLVRSGCLLLEICCGVYLKVSVLSSRKEQKPYIVDNAVGVRAYVESI
jgi:hypothetical protein